MKNYLFWIIAVGAVMGGIWLAIILNNFDKTSFDRRVEYVSLKVGNKILPQLTSKLFVKIAEKRFYYDFAKIGIFPSDVQLKKGRLDSACLEKMDDLWGSVDVWNKLNRKMISETYYECGLLAYERGDMNTTVDLFNMASVFCPDWSYYYLELASITLEQGERQSLQTIFDRCYQNIYARDNCRSNYDMYTLDNGYPVGYWEEKILGIN